MNDPQRVRLAQRCERLPEDVDDAAEKAKRLVERDKVDFLIGPLVSQETVPTVAVTTEGKIAQFTNAGTSALNPQNGPYHFSLNTSSATVAEAMVSYVAQHMPGATVGILADDGGIPRPGLVRPIWHSRTGGVNRS